jgi:hypothetical protein
MLRRNVRVLPAELHGRLRAVIHHQLLRAADELLCSRVHGRVRSDVHSCVRPDLHELLLGRLLELLRTGDLHHRLLRRMVPRLLGRSRSHTLVGSTDYVCRRVSDIVRSRLRTEHLLVVPVRLRCGLRSGMPNLFELLQLLGLLGFAMQHVCIVRTGAVQFMFDLYRGLRARSVLRLRFVVRLQLVRIGRLLELLVSARDAGRLPTAAILRLCRHSH